MRTIFEMIKADYLQRTRSYGFLITLAVSLLAAYYFVPSPSAGYTTMKIASYVGYYNSAWVGHATAVLTCMLLGMIGFYLINNSIKRDIQTGVGVIISTTPVSNLKYLFSKTLSNFLVLLSIVATVLLMGLFLVITRGSEFPFDIVQFVLPFIMVTIPCVFAVSALAVTAEVIFRKNQILQNIAYFIFFCIIIDKSDKKNSFDFFGVRYVTDSIESYILSQYDPAMKEYVIGFDVSPVNERLYFLFNGITWSNDYIMSRMYLILFSIVLIIVMSLIFHRFNIREKFASVKKTALRNNVIANDSTFGQPISSLTRLSHNYSLIPLIKTELALLFTKGARWFWLANFGVWISLFFTEQTLAHQILLPVLLCMQINRWSDLFIKDETHFVHYFTYTSYQPIKRLLTARMIAALLLAFIFTIPMIIRFVYIGYFYGILTILIGIIVLISASLFFGVLSGGSKIFEVLLIFFTYGIIQRVPFMDYVGYNDPSVSSRLWFMMIAVTMIIAGFYIRNYKISNQ